MLPGGTWALRAVSPRGADLEFGAAAAVHPDPSALRAPAFTPHALRPAQLTKQTHITRALD